MEAYERLVCGMFFTLEERDGEKCWEWCDEMWNVLTMLAAI